MKTTKLYFIFVLLGCMQAIVGQQSSTITLLSDVDNEVTVYEPIGGLRNPFIPSQTIELKANKPYVYKTPILEYGSFAILFCPGYRVRFELLEKDSICLFYKHQLNTIDFSGDNAEGHKLLHPSGNGDRFDPIIEIIGAHISDRIDINGINKDFAEFRQSFRNKLFKMVDEGKISQGYAEIQDRIFEGFDRGVLCMQYRDMLVYGRPFSYKANEQERKILAREMDRLYEESLKYFSPKDRYSFYYSTYAPFKFAQLGESQKSKLMGKYTDDTFGIHYKPYTMLPVAPQMDNIISSFIYDIQTRRNSCDFEKLYRYIQDKDAKNPYLPILRTMLDERSPKAQL